MYIWIYFTILAALMQAVRTAGQKQLSQRLNAMSTTLVRFLFALPFAWIYVFLTCYFYQIDLPSVNPVFLKSAFLASMSQIMATFFLIIAFRYQNFAVATSLAKTEALLTALVGVLAFDAALSGFGWLSVFVGVCGVLVLSKSGIRLSSIFQSPASLYGIAAGLGFALATLWIRQASLSLSTNLVVSAAFTLAFMVSLQSGLVMIYIYSRDKQQYTEIKKNWRLSSFVGITSLFGSIGWFTAASFQTAAYVKSLGQIEFFFTLFITRHFFRESISSKEYLGMVLIIISVVMLLFLA